MTEAGKSIRKSVYELTREEKEAFIQALLKLKWMPSPASGRTWDSLRWHQESFFFNPVPVTGRYPWYISYAHCCPAFLAWHRQYLRLLELDLQAVYPATPSVDTVLGLGKRRFENRINGSRSRRKRLTLRAGRHADLGSRFYGGQW
jgi:tyrosinase-like protein